MRNIENTVQFRWFDEVWNKDDEQAIHRMMTPDVIAHGLAENPGPEGFSEFYRNFRNQFSDVHVEVADVMVDGDMEVSRCNVTAIETASSKPVQFSGACITRIDNGKIAEAWNFYDFLSVQQQLGNLPTPTL